MSRSGPPAYEHTITDFHTLLQLDNVPHPETAKEKQTHYRVMKELFDRSYNTNRGFSKKERHAIEIFFRSGCKQISSQLPNIQGHWEPVDRVMHPDRRGAGSPPWFVPKPEGQIYYHHRPGLDKLKRYLSHSDDYRARVCNVLKTNFQWQKLPYERNYRNILHRLEEQNAHSDRKNRKMSEHYRREKRRRGIKSAYAAFHADVHAAAAAAANAAGPSQPAPQPSPLAQASQPLAQPSPLLFPSNPNFQTLPSFLQTNHVVHQQNNQQRQPTPANNRGLETPSRPRISTPTPNFGNTPYNRNNPYDRGECDNPLEPIEQIELRKMHPRERENLVAIGVAPHKHCYLAKNLYTLWRTRPNRFVDPVQDEHYITEAEKQRIMAVYRRSHPGAPRPPG